ncbi:hypothetical protein [Pseudomonas gingeri]|uniref:Uncharacterized protein n=1 Tax=Pseudomonas gingeri TaxID=117681 RepID=A0A7Y7YCR0_9PSED|nr:hypothetical protein [Pseudomonas gingeri]NWA02371.1 hypothetical protein [Pseudomonas gingeri]NWA12456.1 hypothetical protein [Pseudomonas gingeri]NWA57138.1 hypothetical protein [Pseudomonas gingeri]NWA93481.1 hypothetical protein [Pseudomonas gingeri]NWB02953.1 hypothetical protein [Pseudomonas gingeri]
MKMDLRETWQVESFVRRYFQGSGEVHRLRTLLSGGLPVTHFLGDEEVLRQLSRSLQSGALCAYLYPRQPTIAVRQPGPAGGKAVARQTPRPTGPAPVPRTDIELVTTAPVSRERVDAAQDVEAAMLEDAAKSATPFCEECERARLQRQGQG